MLRRELYCAGNYVAQGIILRRELCCAGNYIETLVLYNTVKYERLVLSFAVMLAERTHGVFCC